MRPLSFALAARAAAGMGDPPALDARLRDRLGASSVLLLDAGTAALRIAMQLAARRRPGRPVAIPAWGCYDLLSAAMGAGVPILWYDLDPATLQPESGALARVREAGPAAMVVVHPFGIAADVPAIAAALEPDTPIIEDAAQGWGGTLHGRPLGAHGDVSILSFGRGKGITGGSGGALAFLTDRLQLDADLAPGGVAQGGWKDLLVASALLFMARPELYGIPAAMPFLRLGETVFKPPRPPARMSRAATALIAATMEAADREAQLRRENAAQLIPAISRSVVATNVAIVPQARPGWLRLPVLARDAAAAAGLVRQGGEWGVARGYPMELPALARQLGVPGESAGGTRGASELVARLVTLPTHSRLTTGDLRALAALFPATKQG